MTDTRNGTMSICTQDSHNGNVPTDQLSLTALHHLPTAHPPATMPAQVAGPRTMTEAPRGHRTATAEAPIPRSRVTATTTITTRTRPKTTIPRLRNPTPTTSIPTSTPTNTITRIQTNIKTLTRTNIPRNTLSRPCSSNRSLSRSRRRKSGGWGWAAPRPWESGVACWEDCFWARGSSIWSTTLMARRLGILARGRTSVRGQMMGSGEGDALMGYCIANPFPG
ncbi:uncharacterized protein BO66DRAFT_475972 [Aspergillus aculeatinus CBS 121060]|uniref:Uncharacterized protein n=1 Tax=Aspergillus aculeatinus CBS 121060 TaxID=1448322 RepID=A0ACD1GRY4_9EURO|nr:hypothetical protein BO66DRAFT_475972 [Aspergillus aculeatinus CBS 121060]RAH64211.1 hypothetical protein BO66DRAFT_475972 [Aspergillus aculeatinus CBS 121060]